MYKKWWIYKRTFNLDIDAKLGGQTQLRFQPNCLSVRIVSIYSSRSSNVIYIYTFNTYNAIGQHRAEVRIDIGQCEASKQKLTSSGHVQWPTVTTSHIWGNVQSK